MQYFPRCVVILEALFDQQVGSVRPATLTVIPRRVEWQRNSPRRADRLTVTVSYRDFPLDPRLLSAVHVRVYAADVESEQGRVELSPANLRFQGFADVPETTLGMDDAEVKFECRDYTALYLNRSWRRVADEQPITATNKRSRIRIPRGQTLQQFVAMVRDRLAPRDAANNPIQNSIEPPPTVFDVPEVRFLRVDKRAAKQNLAMRERDSAWDVLTVVCQWFAQLPVWDIDPVLGPVLRIRSASATGRSRAELQFGSNIERLAFRRNLQAPERKAVRIIAWNPRSGEIVEGVFPRLGLAAGETPTTLDENAKQTSTRSRSELKRVQYVFEGDFTQADVTTMAELMYLEQAQGRIMGEVETREMVGSQGQNLLDLANGDRLILDIGPQTLVGVDHLSTTEAAAFLSNPRRSNSLSPEVALALVEAYRQVEQLAIEFFVLEAVHTWDHNEGYKLKVTFTDFLLDQVRAAGEAS